MAARPVEGGGLRVEARLFGEAGPGRRVRESLELDRAFRPRRVRTSHDDGSAGSILPALVETTIAAAETGHVWTRVRVRESDGTRSLRETFESEEIDAEVVEQTLGSVLKYREDIEAVRDETLVGLIEEARTTAKR